MSNVIVISDLFIGVDGALIETRPPEIGSWNPRGDSVFINSNRLTNGIGNYLITFDSFYSVVMAAAADMSLSIDFTTISFETMILLCRMSTTDPIDAYGLESGPGGDKFVRYTAGVKSTLKTITLGVVAGDTVKFEVSGSTLKAYVNSVLIDSVVNSAIASGVLGFKCEQNGSAQFWDNAVGYTEIAPASQDMMYFGVG